MLWVIAGATVSIKSLLVTLIVNAATTNGKKECEHTMTTKTTNRPARTPPDWPTYRGYLGIILATLAAFVFTARTSGAFQIVFVLIWIAMAGALVSFTKYDRRRRAALTEKDS